MSAQEIETTIHQRPAELLQQLVRFDTTNPPGIETECLGYIDRLLTSVGIKTSILAKDPSRPNLVARLPGRGVAPPLLIYAHIDVVSTENQKWQVPPFEGRIVDGVLWGRGTLDDKGGAAMSLSAFLRTKAEGFTPPGDVILAMLCDEEAGGWMGANYLVENHADLFSGVRYALGEVGGFTLYLAGRKFYPIMVSEKRMCSLRATVRGPALHAAAAVVRGGAAAKMGYLLTQLDQAHLPLHLTPAAKQMLEVISSNTPFPANLVLRQLLNPALAGKVLALLGSTGETLYPLLHNTFNVTKVCGGEQVGTSPAQVSTEIFACVLPGYSPEDLVAELRHFIGDEVELEITHPGEAIPEKPDMGLFDTLCDILCKADPEGVPAPLMLTAPTDARHFARLGIQTYGFQPMKVPPDIDIARMAHAADERVPVEAIEFGSEAIYQVLHRFGET